MVIRIIMDTVNIHISQEYSDIARGTISTHNLFNNQDNFVSGSIRINRAVLTIPMLPCFLHLPSVGKPYHWRSKGSIEQEIDRNHNISNIRFKAVVAAFPIKDTKNKRPHCVLNYKESQQQALNEAQNYSNDPKGELFSLDKVEEPQPTFCQKVLFGEQSSKINMLSNKEIYYLATNDKASSIYLQDLVCSLNPEGLNRFRSFLEEYHLDLMYDRLGNYFVSKMVEIDENSRKMIEKSARRDFLNLSSNEFCSRVLQKIVGMSTNFRSFMMAEFKENLHLYLRSKSAGFLISYGIIVCDSESQRDVISSYLESISSHWYKNKIFRKVLLSYISFCDLSKLDLVFHLLTSKMRIESFLHDKYATFALVRLLERSHFLTRETLLSELKARPFEFLQQNYFGFFISEINKWEKAAYFGSEVNKVLLQVQTDLIAYREISQRIDTLQAYDGAISIHTLTLKVRTKRKFRSLELVSADNTTQKSK